MRSGMATDAASVNAPPVVGKAGAVCRVGGGARSGVAVVAYASDPNQKQGRTGLFARGGWQRKPGVNECGLADFRAGFLGGDAAGYYDPSSVEHDRQCGRPM